MSTATTRPPQLGDRLADVPVNTIHPDPNQPRSVITDQDIADMADSIKAIGLQERVMLRMRPEGGYWLVAGETRWRAYLALERLTIPAIVRLDLNDEAKAFEAAFVSNFARKDMDPIDEAEGLRRIFHDARLGSNMQLARRVDRTLSYVTDRLLLNWLSDEDKQAVRDGRMPLSEAVPKAREISGRKGAPRLPVAASSAPPRHRRPAPPTVTARGFGSGRDPWGAPVSISGGSHAAAPKPAVAAPPSPLPAPAPPAFSASPEAAPRLAPAPSPAPSRSSDADRLRSLLLRAVRAGRAAGMEPDSPTDDALVDEILAGELARS